MNCCGEKKEEKAEGHAPHAAQGHSYGGCCGGGWMQWLMIAILLIVAASYVLK